MQRIAWSFRAIRRLSTNQGKRGNMRNGYQAQRERFIVLLRDRGFSYDAIYSILRNSATINRLSEAQCNGDYPAQDPNYTQSEFDRYMRECSECGSHWRRGSLTQAGVCQECRAHARVRKLIPDGWRFDTPSLWPCLFAPGQDPQSSQGIGVPLR